jgi:tape measure domain-containing protein
VAVVANVAINVDSRGAAQKLREVADRSKQVDRAAKGSSQSLAGQSRQLQSVATSASRTTAAFNGLAGALGKVAAAFSVIQGARFVFAKTAELETQTRSLTVLTGSAQRATQIIRELQQLGAVTPFTSTELIDAAKRLQAFGVEGDKVVETTRRLADVSGATGAELEGLVTAYGQVQAKGRLQGEELLQFQERGVALQQVLREQYGLTGEEFQKALEKGQISAQAVEVALLKLTDAGGKYANGAITQSDTLAGRLSTLQDSIQNLAARLGTILAPAMQSILGLAIDIANQINSVF